MPMCATCGSKEDHNKGNEFGTFTHQFDYGVDAQVWREEEIIVSAYQKGAEAEREEIEK